MWMGVRRIPSLVAIYAIAMHTILWGAGPLPSSASVDPLFVVCHAVVPSSAPGEQTPAGPDRTPTHACDHCNLCSAIAPPAALDEILAGQFVPARVLHVLSPSSAATIASLTATPKLARGPPQPA